MNASSLSLGVILTLLSWGQSGDFALYVGRSVCVECHASRGEARPCALEPIDAHQRSYHALERPEAEEIAVLCGISEVPRSSRFCLGCHSTAADAGPRWTQSAFDASQGVQCEACHDAGSRHVEWGRARGDRSITSDSRIRRPDRSICVDCHVPRASHDEVLRHGFHLEPADRRYKTPVNMTISPDGRRLYVVCEQSDSVIVVDTRDRRVLSEIAVAGRPHGIALSADGRTLYVTSRLTDSLSVIDTASGRTTAVFPTGNEPHGVCIDPTGRRLYVLNLGDNSVSILDLRSLKEIARLAAGPAPASAALSPDARRLYVTNLRPHTSRFREPYQSEVSVISLAAEAVETRIVVPDANMLQGIDVVPGRRIAVFTLLRTKNLVPITRLAQGWTVTTGLGIAWPDGRVDQVLLDEPDESFPDPMDVAVSPDGRHALVSSGGSDQIAVVNLSALFKLLRTSSNRERGDVLPNDLSASRRYVEKKVRVGRNPRDIVFAPDGRTAYVANALDDDITVLETAGFTVAGKILLGGPGEVSRLRRGARLFHSAAMTGGSQFSCRTCHPEGHTNGLAFDIEADGIGTSPVQVRTLRGILDTAPFKWEGVNPSLETQCGPRFSIFFTRRPPLRPDDLNALVRYLSTIERPRNPYRLSDGLTLAQRRGKEVFERTATNSGDVIPRNLRCTSCHNTPHYTARNRAFVGTTMWLDRPVEADPLDLNDQASFGPLGIVYFHDTGAAKKSFDAPHLNNVFDRPPYLHNGTAATLEEIWTRLNLYESHGMTGDLTRCQFNDLIAYLKSL